MARKNEGSRDYLQRVLKDFEEARKHHDVFASKADRRYRAYRGIMERRSEANTWHSKLHPPYILQIIETMVASLVDPNPKIRVRPRLKVASGQELQQQLDAARTFERVLAYQFDLDRLAEKQRPFVLQGLITGLSVGKTYWNYREGKVRSRGYEERYVETPFGIAPQSLPTVRAQDEVLDDDPCFEVVDVRDFLWHEAATSLDTAKYVIHRTWTTYDELKAGEELGIYGKQAGGSPVDAVKESRTFESELQGREQELFNTDRTKDQIELLEYWAPGKRCVVANRKVLLAEGPNPFWHGQYPFVVTSSMPDLFRVPGISEVEVVEQLQEMLWLLQNQRIDNVRLMNNFVTLVRDSEDYEAFEMEPGAKWPVADPNGAAVPLLTDKSVSEITLQHEALLKGDLQNITGGMPFMSGTESQTIDQQTATGVSIVTNLAQRRLASKRQNFLWAWKRVAEQFIALDQQFISEPKLIEVAGPDGDYSFVHVSPDEIQGRFDVIAEATTESLMRQERRAEQQAKLQIAMNLAPFMSAQGTPLNLKAFLDDFLDAFDAQDKERYYSAQPPPPMMGAPAPNQPNNGAPSAEPQGFGVTSPLASNPQSPSNEMSLAPGVFNQRAGAMGGGPVNA